MTISASAPTRIDLAGGTLDIWPLYLFHAGAQTLNVAISLRAHARVDPRSDEQLALVSEDTGRSVMVTCGRERAAERELPLLARLAEAFGARDVTLTTRGEGPAGAGIAGSSALTIAVCGALARWSQSTLDPDSLLHLAMNVESQVIGVPTGVQDYRPALYGGAAAIELSPRGVARVPLEIDEAELERRLVLCYTGAPRNSGTNNWEITKRHIDGDRHVFDCFERIRDTAHEMRQSIARGDWDDTARHVATEWENRKRLAPGVTTPAIDALVASAAAAGAGGTKVCGAGGGGCLFSMAEPRHVPRVRDALARAGARLLEFRMEHDGLRVTDGAG